MKVIVTSTSTSLEALLTAKQKQLIEERKADFGVKFALLLQNRSGNPIYLENIEDTATTDSYALAGPSEKIQPIGKISDIYLMANTDTDLFLSAELYEGTRY